MTLRVGDRAPKAIAITIDTGSTSGLLVDSVRIKALHPGGEVDWGSVAPLSSTALSVSLVMMLDSSGSSFPRPGPYRVRAWAYDASDNLLFDTEIEDLKVEPAIVSWPI